MNRAKTAAELASMGRYGDTELVHMNRTEVAALEGLASLAGSRLTRNPSTGLPEAFSLSSLLPTILGVGATMIGGPLAGAAVSGITEGVRSGDAMRGLTAGVFSAGLGSAMGNLGSAGAGAAGGQAAYGMAAPVTDMATQSAAQMAPMGAAEMVAQPFMTPDALMPALGEQTAQQGLGQLGPRFTDAQAAGQGFAPMPGSPSFAQGLQGQNRLADFALRGVDKQYPGWNPSTMFDNASNLDFSSVPTAAKYGVGIGGLGMAKYWADDATAEANAEADAAANAESKRIKDRYDYYANIARSVNSGQMAAPTFLPPYSG